MRLRVRVRVRVRCVSGAYVRADVRELCAATNYGATALRRDATHVSAMQASSSRPKAPARVKRGSKLQCTYSPITSARGRSRR